MRYRLALKSKGDTIVEVLVVLAVLGLALATSSAIANKGLQQSRNAQEHSEALGIIDSQVELLHAAIDNGVSLPGAGTPFCMKSDTGSVIPFPPSPDLNTLNNTNYPAGCTPDPGSFYYKSIVGDGTGNYEFKVLWDGIGSLGPQKETISYRI